MIDKMSMEPHQVVLDLVLVYSATMPALGHAAVLNGTLILAARNHRGEYVSLSMPIWFGGEPDDGGRHPPRFVLRKIWPGVWKLAPSVLHPLLHAYVTVVGVPEHDLGWSDAPRAPTPP